MSRLDKMIDAAFDDAAATRLAARQSDPFLGATRQRPTTPTASTTTTSESSGADTTTPTEPTEMANDGGNATTTPSLNLPSGFWQARPELDHIRRAAWSRGRSPDAVLAGVLCRVALLVPPRIKLPALVSSAAALNCAHGAVGASGAGKSAARDIAADLLVVVDPDAVTDALLGSGEGLVDVFLGDEEEKLDHVGRKRKVRPQVRRAAMVVVDEGSLLGDIGKRQGSSLMPTIRSAWSGAALGNSNAAGGGRSRYLPAHAYRLAMLVAVQDAAAVEILRDVAGTAQRFVWHSSTDPSIPPPASRPEWPGELRPHWPDFLDVFAEFVVVADVVADEIRADDYRKNRGDTAGDDPLDGHVMLCRLKVAALLGVLDGRLDVNETDWGLAGMVIATSRAVRSFVLEADRQANRQRDRYADAKAVSRALAVDDTRERRALDKMMRRVAVVAHGEPARVFTRAQLNSECAGRDREFASVDDAIAASELRKWLTRVGAGWQAGTVSPTS